jgi:membrane protein required for colicin V production
MNAIDIVILAALGFAVLNGFRQGFVVQIGALVGVLLGLAIARLEYRVVRDLLGLVFGHSAWTTAVSYLIVVAVISAVVIAIARGVRRVIRLLLLGWADRAGGALLGLLTGAIAVELLLYLAKRVPSSEIHRLVNHSLLAPAFLHAVPLIDRFFPHIPQR